MANVPCMERLRMAHGLAGSEDWACEGAVRRGRAEGPGKLAVRSMGRLATRTLRGGRRVMSCLFPERGYYVGKYGCSTTLYTFNAE